MYKVGEIISIDEKEYVIFSINDNYYCLQSVGKPLQLLVIKDNNGEFETVADNEELQRVLGSFVSS